MTRNEVAPSRLPLRLPLSAQGRLRRAAALLGGVGVGMAMAATPSAAVAGTAAKFGSQAWFSAQTAGSTGKQNGEKAGGALSGSLSQGVTTPDVALQRAERSIADLSRATEAIAQAQAAQAAARQLALSSPGDVPDGLAEGGLVIGGNAAYDAAHADECASRNLCSWFNADLPTQQVHEGETTVTVEQNDNKAILTWDSFNIGQNTTLHIDQSAGTQADGSNDWVALNRISGASTSASRILGNIEAEGSVYLLNQNGILFGGSSQVNVHTLLASTLPLYAIPGAPSLTPGEDEDYLRYSNKVFLENGLTSVGRGTANGYILGAANGSVINLSELPGLPGDIVIEAGSHMATDAQGFSLIAAPNIQNAGWIEASEGQAILAAGIGVSLRNPSSGAALLDPILTGSIVDDSQGNADVTPRSQLLNTGLIESTRGNITLLSFSIEQSGVVVATTSVSQAGSITMSAQDQQATDSSARRTGLLVLGEGSVTALLPDTNEETTTSSDAADDAFEPGSIKLTAAAITLKSGALIEAPGQNVSLTAVAANDLTVRSGLVDGTVTGRLYIAEDAVIDVAGLANVAHDMADNLVTVPRLGGNELADSPLQRTGVLLGSSITVDLREAGADDDGNAWVGTPVANVEGYINEVPQSVQDLLQNGGAISLLGGEVITRSGSTLNLDGGYQHYLGGMVQTTRLIAANGAIVDISQADADETYIGIAGVYTRESERWNQTAQFVNPLIGLGGHYESAYIEGGDAGQLNVYGSTATVLNGTISAQAFAGRHQVEVGEQPAGGSFYAGGGSGGSYISALFPDILSATVGPSYAVVEQVRQLASDFGADTALSVSEEAIGTIDDVFAWTQISSADLEDAGFAHVTLAADDPSLVKATSRPPQGGEVLVTAAGLSVQNGGSITLVGARVNIEGDLVARSGNISVTGTGNTAVAGSTVNPDGLAVPEGGDITVASGVTLDTSGIWVNDTGLDEDRLRGDAWSDGGSVTLQTLQYSVGAEGSEACGDLASCVLDTTGSIRLERGSLIDVSSGGRVDQLGRLVEKDGVIQGQGGSLSLLTYMPTGDGDTIFGSQFLQLPTDRPNSGRIRMNGDIRAYGFSGGGSFSVRALGILIGEDGQGHPAGTVRFEAADFNQGFGSYVLTGVYDASLAAGTEVRITQSNFIGNRQVLLQAATGSDLYEGSTQGSDGAYVAIGQLDAYYRQATDFTMYAGDYLNWRTDLAEVPSYPGSAASGTLLLGEGASLVADAGADIVLGSVDQLTVYGSIVAHGGSITLTGDTADGGYAPLPGVTAGDGGYTSASDAIWLGADALLDVSGVALIDPYPELSNVDGVTRQPRTGALLDGGTITLSNDAGYIIALDCHDAGSCRSSDSRGATLDVSGTATRFDLPANGDQGYLRQGVWSDAGEIRIGAGAGLYFDGYIQAQGGADGAAGGTLSVNPLNDLSPTNTGFSGADRLVVRNHPPMPETALIPGQIIEPDADLPSGVIYISADRIEGSGIESLYLGVDPQLHDANPTEVVLAHDLNLTLARTLSINASTLSGLISEEHSESQVVLTAGYFSLHGYAPGAAYEALDTLPKPPEGVSLVVNAEAIDIGGQFSLRNFSEASFNSEGDIRFVTPAAYAYYVGSSGSAQRATGVLYTAGDLNFRADQLYPATDNAFIIAAVGYKNPEDGTRADTSIYFLSNSDSRKSDTPLSAGGALYVDSDHIFQSGVIRAPGGEIVLGVANPFNPDEQALFSYLIKDGSDSTQKPLQMTPTETLRLMGGSITSVALDGLTVPYGQTVDGENWQYDGTAQLQNGASNVADLTAPPDKFISVNANAISVHRNATIDLSGGGDLQSQEWVPGTGGSRDVLSQYNTVYTSGGEAVQQPIYGDARPVYAVIPGYEGALGAYDPALAAGDPMVGQSVYLSGIPGLKDGVYTLLPGQYATLPGAYRVVQDTASIDTHASQNTRLADGSYYVSGQFVDGFTGAQDARSTAFIVQSAEVWQQYSEYTLTSANTYFAEQAQQDGTLRARLPVDAGQLVLEASRKLRLRGEVEAGFVEGGEAALIDIAADQIQIVDAATGDAVVDGYVQLDASELSALGAGSLLVGGRRLRTDAGDRVTVVASDVLVSNTAEALQLPEILLVSNAEGGGIRVQQNAQLVASGEAVRSASVLIGTLPSYKNNGSVDEEGVSGAGALLRLSTGGDITVNRVNVPGMDAPGEAAGLLELARGAKLSAEGSILLDSTGDTLVHPEVRFDAPLIDLVSSHIVFDAAAPASAGDGVVIGDALLQQFSDADTLVLRSRGNMDFLGDLNFDFAGTLSLSAAQFAGDGGAVSIAAERMTLDNALAGSSDRVTAGSGSLALSASVVELGEGDAEFAGFASVSVEADEGVLLSGSGIDDFGSAALSLRTPVVAAASGADRALRSDGALTLVAITSGDEDASAALGGMGGSFHLEGASVAIDTVLRALSGNVDVFSSTGDVRLGQAATISVQGAEKTVYDVQQFASGGGIRLEAAGDLVLAAGSVLDFSGADSGGDAGSLELVSAGDARLDGSLDGVAVEGYTGADFSLDTGGAVNLDALAGKLADGGVTQRIAVRTRAGNLSLSAGSVLRASEVELTADGGNSPGDTAGNVIVLGSIDASGEQGGSIALYGSSSVQVEGSLIARGSADDQRGGDVVLATSGQGNGSYNADFGYQNVSAQDSGRIVIGSAARIDVRGGSSGGLEGGQLTLRAPLLDDGEVSIFLVDTSNILGAREVSLEAYATWSTADASTGNQHFDGIVDAAGMYDSAGALVDGGNLAHLEFYQHTLMNFVRGPGFAFESRLSGIDNLAARPGIDLVNPDGDIRVLSDWNLGSGSWDADARLLTLDYRYRANVAPVLSLRAAGDIALRASISDGFFQVNNPLGADSADVDNSASPVATASNPLPMATATLDGYTLDEQGDAVAVDSSSYRFVAGADVGSSNPLGLGEAEGSIRIDGHVQASTVEDSRLIVAPNLIRTGTGFIAIAANGAFGLLDTVAPGVIYTAGRATGPRQGGLYSSLVETDKGNLLTIETNWSQSEAAGDLTLLVAGDIQAVERVVDADGTLTGKAGTELSQYWWQWLAQACTITRDGCEEDEEGSSVNFGGFRQGLLSLGGDVTVRAGGDIVGLSASLPTTWSYDIDYTTILTVGGGNLYVRAAGDILGGSYFVAEGEGRIRAGRSIAANPHSVGDAALPTLLALQQAQLRVSASDSVDIGGVYNPSYLFTASDSQKYSADSALWITASAGDVAFNTASSSLLGDGSGALTLAFDYVLPSSLRIDALGGGIRIERRGELYPSATGQLSLIAEDDIRFYDTGSSSGGFFGLIDADPATMPSPEHPISSIGVIRSRIDSGSDSQYSDHDPDLLHLYDAEPVRIYSLSGDLINGDGDNRNGLIIATPKAALLRAGRDIVNLSFQGQNLYASDITLIQAGRDLYDTPLLAQESVPVIELGGPGALVLEAGRDIGPLNSANEALDQGYLLSGSTASYPGIRTVGNRYNAYLSRSGADISLIFGVANGVAADSFAAQYIAPGATVEGIGSYGDELVAFMDQIAVDGAARYGASTPEEQNVDEAWAQFQLLPEYQRRQFVYSVFFDILDRTGLDYNDPDSLYYQQYARGYQAISALFPPELGYTANSLAGGENGAETLIATGNFDMRGSTVQTEFGGDINILGPGGDVLIGSASAPPYVPETARSRGIGPNDQGILTLRGGSIRLFSDGSSLLAQSRVFTEQGGDILIWSSNGDINAGKGAKTTTEVVQQEYVCDEDHHCIVDAAAAVSGAGIAALQSDADAEAGSANLIAPRGTVDAGDAGIRVSGNLNVAALRVANADNIQVQGNQAGVPSGLTDTGALAVASSVAAAVQQSAELMATGKPQETAATLVTVEVLGFGDATEEQP